MNVDFSNRRAAHLCIDMQRMFAEQTEWHTPWMASVLPVVTEIAGRHAARTIFTRFIPPERPEDAPGAWRGYFERWRRFTRSEIDPELLELVGPLRDLVPPATLCDKPGLSAFERTDLYSFLLARRVDTVVVTGAETDVCVLATVLSAVDHGFLVVLPKDALCSSADETHDALLTLYAKRFAKQVILTDAEHLLSRWTAA
ncbi:cysteine hydrolase family protein [Methylopila sp. Yamaguchi]|uniref:cysteine hydrolase family protein n=1 Tax=Methylopila sp. Yamaguchi TaxID=1437817 RepID=UPI000CB386BF|nr:isochorismatase family cysteine hydrolase [Methylopila sp. Yamaguchi]GBD50209.1 isochorismatase hydrolase [Methylopila sp. Yamaguchi]